MPVSLLIGFSVSNYVAYARTLCLCALMVGKPTPCFLDECLALGFVHGSRRWRSVSGKRLYTWDDFHGEVEVFTARGVHLGAADALTGVLFKLPVKGRKIDV